MELIGDKSTSEEKIWAHSEAMQKPVTAHTCPVKLRRHPLIPATKTVATIAKVQNTTSIPTAKLTHSGDTAKDHPLFVSRYVFS